MINYIHGSHEDSNKKEKLEQILELFSNLKYCNNINEMAFVVCNWLKKLLQVKNIYFNLYNMEQDKSSILVQKGNEFSLEDPNSFYFILDTNTELKALVAFQSSDIDIVNYINQNKEMLEFLSLFISPIIENGVMKKLYVDSNSIDSVTNVYTREYLLKHIEDILSLNEQEDDNITFLMIGIDRFKAVIDEFDYDIGNRVLKELAKVIHSNIHSQDIVARVIGDEFLVALLNSSEKKTLKVVKNIIRIFGKTETIVNDKTGQSLKKSICIGISSYPNDSKDIHQVIKNADAALYIAKDKKRGSYEIYNEEEDGIIELF